MKGWPKNLYREYRYVCFKTMFGGGGEGSKFGPALTTSSRIYAAYDLERFCVQATFRWHSLSQKVCFFFMSGGSRTVGVDPPCSAYG